MLGHSHAVSGALAWTLITPILPRITGVDLQPEDVLVGAILCSGAALLPDLDHHDGTIANFLGPPSKLLARFIGFISGGHRHATHSLLFAVISGLGVFAGERYGGRYFTLGLAFALLALAVKALHLCPPGEGIHSWGVILVEAIAGVWIIDHWIPATPIWLPYVVVIGCLAHLVGDCLTERGCPLLWPINKRMGIPIISHTGNRLETWFFAPAMVVGTVVALWFFLSGNGYHQESSSHHAAAHIAVR